MVDGHSSPPCQVSSGVPQGSVIGPILFLVYINDLPETVKSHVQLFADDTVIYNTSDNRQQLQEDLVALERWETDWSMEFNPLKCEHVRFTRKRTKGVDNTYRLHDIAIPKVSGAKYLGVKLENSLRWNINTNYIVSKASSRLGYVRRTIPASLPQLRSRAYKQLLRPVMEYACAVWDAGLTSTQVGAVEAVQRRAARMVHDVRRTDRTTSTTQLVKQLDWDMLGARREVRRLGLFRAMHFREVATDVSEHVTPRDRTYETRHHDSQYTLPHCNTKLYQRSFFIDTSRLWNQLPPTSPILSGPPVAG